ncbi:MAG: TauD/TfdA family dioxygenase [Mariniblastus sp.]|nr:TauD/TfdA family dioxygenase [Mariniblastus sp.]
MKQDNRTQSPRTPIEHPSVWQGKELLDRPDWDQSITPTEQAEFEQLADGSSIEETPELQRRCESIRDSLETGCGGVHLRGLRVSHRSSESLSRGFLELAGSIGYPVSQSAAGEKIFSVRNAGYAEQDPRARGPNTRKKLSFHTDRCDVIGFLCIRQARSGGENQVVSSPALFNQMLDQHPELLEVLMRPFYYQRHNVDMGNQMPYTQQPIFSIYQGYFAANFLRVLIERAHANPDLPDLTPRQRQALDCLESIAARPEMHYTFRQESGDILLLNNWVTLHRRTEFEDFEDPALGRHILRAWLSMPNSRPIDPLFAGNYGQTKAGAIRGGMRAVSS